MGIQGVMRPPRGERGAVCHYVVDRGPALCLRPVGTHASELTNVVGAGHFRRPAVIGAVRAHLWSRAYRDAAGEDFEFMAMDDERSELRFNPYQVMRELLPRAPAKQGNTRDTINRRPDEGRLNCLAAAEAALASVARTLDPRLRGDDKPPVSSGAPAPARGAEKLTKNGSVSDCL